MEASGHRIPKSLRQAGLGIAGRCDSVRKKANRRISNIECRSMEFYLFFRKKGWKGNKGCLTKETTKLLILKIDQLIKPVSKLASLIQENNELISIFVTSIRTAKNPRKIYHS